MNFTSGAHNTLRSSHRDTNLFLCPTHLPFYFSPPFCPSPLRAQKLQVSSLNCANESHNVLFLMIISVKCKSCISCILLIDFFCYNFLSFHSICIVHRNHILAGLNVCCFAVTIKQWDQRSFRSLEGMIYGVFRIYSNDPPFSLSHSEPAV